MAEVMKGHVEFFLKKQKIYKENYKYCLNEHINKCTFIESDLFIAYFIFRNRPVSEVT